MKKPPLVEPSLGPDEKLTAYMRLHRELTSKKKALAEKLKPIANELTKVRSDLSRVGTAIHHLKHGSDAPLVTDHAIVRYLERVEGVDVEAIRFKIAGHSRAVKDGNVIVTVNGDDNEQTAP